MEKYGKPKTNIADIQSKKIRGKSRSKSYNTSDYKLAMQIYYINKAKLRKEPKLPFNDYRRSVKTRRKKVSLISVFRQQIAGHMPFLKKASERSFNFFYRTN